MKIIYFSATGNSLYVAKSFNATLISVTKIIDEKITTISDDEAIGIVCPTLRFDISDNLKLALTQCKIQSPYIFLIMTCSNSSGNSAYSVKKILNKNHIKLNYANEIRMTGTHVTFDDLKRQLKLDKKVDKNLNLIISEIKNRRDYIKSFSFKNFLIQKIAKIIAQNRLDDCRSFYVENTCVRCGKCSFFCPNHNIKHNRGEKPTFGVNCVGCLSCLHNCPLKAIKIKNDLNPELRYKNSHIQRLEIMSQNLKISQNHLQ